MCIGIPMRVIESQGLVALCEGRGGRRRLDLALVGEQPAGTWLLAFLDAAREVIEADSARLINAALDGLEAAMRGDTSDSHPGGNPAGNPMDAFFPDLAGRVPELPAHLRAPRS